MTDEWTPEEIAACRRRMDDPLGTGRLDRVESRRALNAIERLTDERDRARATAVALEQQLAEIKDELADTERQYTAADEREFTGESRAALDAVQDCRTTVDVVTDVISGDRCEDMAQESAQ